MVVQALIHRESMCRQLDDRLEDLREAHGAKAGDGSGPGIDDRRHAGRQVAIAGDGQVTMDTVVAKADAVKVRKLDGVGAQAAGVLVGMYGRAAD